MKGYVRENTQQITAGYSALRKCRNAVSAGVLSPISSAVGRNGAVGDKRNACAGGARNSPLRRGRGALRRCAATPHPPPSGAPVSLRVGRFADLTRHRRVIQRREPLKGKADGGVSFNTATHQGGRLEGAPLTPRTPRGEGLRACHSATRATRGEGLAPAGGCSKKVHGFPAKLKGRIKESEYAIKQKER